LASRHAVVIAGDSFAIDDARARAILICSLNVSPLDCDKVTARLWENAPGGNELPQMCMMRAQEWAAEHGITPRDGEYPKVNCSRHEFGARVG
jgi:hypothetical protein